MNASKELILKQTSDHTIDAKLDEEFLSGHNTQAKLAKASKNNWMAHVFLFYVKLFIKRRIWWAQAVYNKVARR